MLHRLAVHAVVRAFDAGPVVASHQSALVMHGLPTWGLDLSHVHVTRLDRRNGRVAAGVCHHQGHGLVDENLAEVEGVTLTGVARAVVEAACASAYESAVVVMDAALNRELTTVEELAKTLNGIRGWPGSGTAREALAFADGRAESVGESRLRVIVDNYGLPTPALQTRFSTSSGQVVARVDFYFRDQAVIVEFDGRIKYRGNAPDVVLREKEREDRLRAGGVIVVRVTWDDLDHPERLVRRIRQAFARAERAGLVRSA